jgi:hypothetical protein
MHSYILVSFTQPEAFIKVKELLQLPIETDRFDHHPDILIIKPEINTKTRTAKKSIKIDMVRTLQTQLLKKPLQLPVQLAIIVDAETMSPAAQNAFLKLLEEPGDYNKLFLLCQNQHQLLPTILSRCQVISSDKESVLPNQTDDLNTEIEQLAHLDIYSRMIALEKYSLKREEANSWLNTALSRLHFQLHQPSFPETSTTLMANFEQTRIAILENTNSKLAFDILAIYWDSQKIQLDEGVV